MMRVAAVAPDGSWLATGSYDRTVRVWNAVSGQERATLTGHADWVSAVAIAPDGSWLAATGSTDQTIRIWNAANGERLALMRVENNIGSCTWLDSAGLAVGGAPGLYLFDFLAGTAPPPAGD